MHQVSYAITRLHSAGTLSVVQNNEILAKNPTICPGPSAPSNSIDLRQLGGSFLLLGLITVCNLYLAG